MHVSCLLVFVFTSEQSSICNLALKKEMSSSWITGK
uniref:Uncharacterized protein n=1 Tax=Nelumbo nucifera TaxID=4432 RepID=A0A822Y2T2_NELNU|nr:TPA_asm: hypothetical protein HUJ06_028030 [Nelumbo nucifera]